jgi:hypothetical protein
MTQREQAEKLAIQVYKNTKQLDKVQNAVAKQFPEYNLYDLVRYVVKLINSSRLETDSFR